MKLSRVSCCTAKLFLLVALSATTLAQTQPSQTSEAPSPPPPQAQSDSPQTQTGPAELPALILGPGDEGDFSVFGVPDMTTHFRVANDGTIDLPLIGRVLVAGLSAEEAQNEAEKRLADGGFVKDPHVTLSIKEYTHEVVTVLGEVNHPGTFSAMSVRRLYDAITAAGGATPRTGNFVTITHKGSKESETIPLSTDPVKSAQSNVEIQPGDTLVVARAGIVYVVGEVTRPGGFVIDQGNSLSVTQLMALSSGPTHLASLGHVKLMHRLANGEMENKDVDVKKILQAKAPDLKLGPDDILWVPASRGKMVLEKGSGSVLSMITGLAIYRF